MPFICCAGVVRRGLCAGGGICLSGEREWISKFGDVVKGSFHSCTGAGAVLKIGRRHVEIPLTRLDEEDAALAASLTGAEARRNLKLAAMLWPFLMKELQKVTWTPAEKNISPRYHEMARKKNAGALTGTRKVDGLVCATSLSIIQGPPFRIREYFRPRARPESGRGQKNFDVVLEQGSRCAYYDMDKGVLIPSKCLSEERTEMRAPVSSLLPPAEQLAARESKITGMRITPCLWKTAPSREPMKRASPIPWEEKKLVMYWNTEGEMVCGVMKLDYDNMRVAALFDGRRKLMNAPGLGYAVILSRLDKKAGA